MPILNISNIFTLTPNLNLTLIGLFQNEKLINHTEYNGVKAWLFQYPGREGRRQEYQLGFRFDWQSLEFLTFSAGDNYVTYWSIDDIVNKSRAEKKAGYQKSTRHDGYQVKYYQSINQQDYENDAYADGWNEERNKQRKKMNVYRTEITQLNELLIDNNNSLNEQQKIAITNNIDDLKKQYNELNIARKKQRNQLPQFKKQTNYGKKELIPDTVDGTYYRPKSVTLLYNPNDGKLHKKDNPFFNGKMNLDEETIDIESGKTVKRYYPKEILDGDQIRVAPPPAETQWEKEQKHKDHGIAPVLSAAIAITDDLSVYLRYAESARMPSLFENSIGFSGQREIIIGEKIKPERAKTQELGIHYNLASL